MNVTRSFLLFSTIVILMSCEKEDSRPSRVQLLTRTDWKLQEVISTPAYPININGTLTNVTDIMAFYRRYNPCFLNQGFHFELGPASSEYQKGLYTYYEADKSCSAQALRDTGTWFFQDNTQIFLWQTVLNDVSRLKTIVTVDQISYSKLILTTKIQRMANGPVYEWKRTYVPVH